MSAMESSAVPKPLLEPSKGLTSRSTRTQMGNRMLHVNVLAPRVRKKRPVVGRWYAVVNGAARNCQQKC
jgi:hypothetical protein